MGVMDVLVYGVHLVSVFFRSAFAHYTQATPQASWCGGAISYYSRSHLVFLQGKVNSARYIAQLVTPRYCHFFDREMLCTFSRTMLIQIRLLRRNVLFVLYNNWFGQQDPQISGQLNTYGT